MATRPERPRWGSPAAAVQVGQTLAVLGAAVLVIGLVISRNATAVWIGAVVLVVGVVVFVLGHRARRRGPGS